MSNYDDLTRVIPDVLIDIEVESVIESAVNKVVEDNSTFQQYRAEMVDTLVHSLEQDATWVSRYEATGELAVPGPPSKDGELGEAIALALKVSRVHSSRVK